MSEADQVERSLTQVVTTVNLIKSNRNETLSSWDEEGVVFKNNVGKYEEGKMSADGALFQVSASNNRSGTVTFNFFGYSDSCLLFDEINGLPVGEDLVNVVCVDTLNNFRHSANKCTITSTYEVKEGKDKGHRIFVLQSPQVKINELIL